MFFLNGKFVPGNIFALFFINFGFLFDVVEGNISIWLKDADFAHHFF